MVKRKQSTTQSPTKLDKVLILIGFVSMTLLALYLTDVLFEGHPVAIFIEVAVYVAILAVYFLALRKGSNQVWVVLARVISCINIAALVLISLFVIYFLMTFSW